MKKSFTILVFVLLLSLSYNISAQQVTDYDGNVYQTVQIGNQIWMAENLKTTHYADGTPLVDGTGAGDITGDYSTKYYFWYNDNPSNGTTFGAVYTWAAAMNGAESSDLNPSGVQGACPDGWHLPSDSEWKELEMFLGMSQEDADAGDFRGTNEASKLSGNADLWVDDVLDSDPEFGVSGFNAEPFGGRYDVGDFDWYTEGTFFWCSTGEEDYAINRQIHYNHTQIRRFGDGLEVGVSVRCVKNSETSINSIKGNDRINIYPNPTKGKINIKLSNSSIAEVLIYDFSGKLIYSERINQTNNKLDLSGLHQGIYLIKIRSKDNVKVEKLIVE